MIASELEPLAELYESDETAWLESMAELARHARGSALDYEHLAEYLNDMARRDRREVENRVAVLIAHLLKWQHQPAKRSRSWLVTAEQQRQELLRLFSSGTLRNHAESTLADTYADGLRLAMAETGLPTTAFLAECPYTLAELLQELVVDDLPEEQ